MAKNRLIGEPVRSKKMVQDLVLWEAEQRYTRTCVAVGPGDYEIGEVLVDEWPQSPGSAHGAQQTFTDVIVLENVVVPDDSVDTYELPVLVRGPALVNLDEIVRANDSENDSTLIARLSDLIAQGIRFVRQPPASVTQEPDLFG